MPVSTDISKIQPLYVRVKEHPRRGKKVCKTQRTRKSSVKLCSQHDRGAIAMTYQQYAT